MDACNQGCRNNVRMDIVYKIIRSQVDETTEEFLVVNQYSGKIEYRAATIDEAKAYVLSR